MVIDSSIVLLVVSSLLNFSFENSRISSLVMVYVFGLCLKNFVMVVLKFVIVRIVIFVNLVRNVVIMVNRFSFLVVMLFISVVSLYLVILLVFVLKLVYCLLFLKLRLVSSFCMVGLLVLMWLWLVIRFRLI